MRMDRPAKDAIVNLLQGKEQPEKELGDSGIAYTEIANHLETALRETIRTALGSQPQQVMTTLQRQVERDLEPLIKDLEELSSVSCWKWKHLIQQLWVKYPKTEKVSLTKD